jgi:hypothetical protein
MGGIDDWIAEHGLDAEIDRMIRTCGYDRVRASIDQAPERFRERGERLIVTDRLPGQRGASRKRDARFYEVLSSAIIAKLRAGLNDKAACNQFASEVAAFKRKLARHDALDQLKLFGLEEIADLDGETLLREWKRIKPHVRSVADAGPEIMSDLLARKGLKTSVKSAPGRPARRGQK